MTIPVDSTSTSMGWVGSSESSLAWWSEHPSDPGARILNFRGIQMPILFPEFVASAFLHSQQLIFQVHEPNKLSVLVDWETLAENSPFAETNLSVGFSTDRDVPLRVSSVLDEDRGRVVADIEQGRKLRYP
ncbi:hypothetical protein CFP56_043118 [Quercus suber]|uniref:Uncharacterized protein n=1 Tax=Quercus suber TaxID=58331 RepID=A0AAW0LHL0_QUESU